MKSGEGTSCRESGKAPATFRDVAACFSEEELKLLHEWQKELYKTVMKEIHQALISLGPVIATSVFSFGIAENDNLFSMDDQDSGRRHEHKTAIAAVPVRVKGEDNFPIGYQANATQAVNSAMDFPSHMLESEIAFVGHNDGNGRHGGTSASSGGETAMMSACIKEEEQTYHTAYLEPEQTQDMYFPVGFPSLISDQEGTFMDHTNGEGTDHCASASSGHQTIMPMSGGIKEEDATDSTSYQDPNEALNTDCPTSYQLELGETDEPPRCSECKKTLTYQLNLKQYQSLQPKERLFLCIECVKTFPNRTLPMTQQSIDTGVRAFPCTECGKSFTRKAYLRQHQRTHTGIKPFPCEECTKRFTRRTHLLEHLKFHTGERPFSCIRCTKSFALKKDLKRHFQIHTR